MVKGLPAEETAPAPHGNGNGRPSPFPIFGSPEIGTTPRSRGHRTEEPRRPEWLKIQLDTGENFRDVKRMIRGLKLHTVCEEAMCPNMGECWGSGTATFLMLGDVCTRNCRFCAVTHGMLHAPEKDEPQKVADAVVELDLHYAVVTSVTRGRAREDQTEM